jgi:hypothetical protein
MTAPTISATPKKALDQRATSRHDSALPKVPDGDAKYESRNHRCPRCWVGMRERLFRDLVACERERSAPS